MQLPQALKCVREISVVPTGVRVVAQVPSLAGLGLSHFRLPGTHVPSFPVLPLRGWSVAYSTFRVPEKL